MQRQSFYIIAQQWKNKLKQTLGMIGIMMLALLSIAPAWGASLSLDASASSTMVRFKISGKEVVEYQASVSPKGEAIIIFAEPVKANLTQLQQKLSAHASQISLSPEGRILRIQLKHPNYRARKFFSDQYVGVDFLQLTPVAEKTQAYSVPAKKQETSPTEALALLEKPRASTPSISLPKQSSKTKDNVNQSSASKENARISPSNPLPTSPVTNREAMLAEKEAKPKPPLPPAETKPAMPAQAVEKKQPPAASSALDKIPSPSEEPKVKETPATEVTVEVPAKAKTPKPSFNLVPESTSENRVPKSELQPLATNVPSSPLSQSLTVQVEEIAGGIRWHFPWKKDTAAAIFERAGVLWVIFNEMAALDTTSLLKAYPEIAISVLPNDRFTILRISGGKFSNIKVYRRSLTWMLEIHAPESTLLIPEKVISQYYSPQAKGIFFPVEYLAKPVRVIDPLIGDSLVVFPVFSSSTGVYPEHRKADFTVLQAAQGVPIVLIGDDVSVQTIPAGIEIFSPIEQQLRQQKSNTPEALPSEGIKKKLDKPHHLKPKLPEKEVKGTALLPFHKWRDSDEWGYVAALQQLQHRITEATLEAQPMRYFDLARFYFSRGLLPETHSIINVMRSIDPASIEKPPVKFLHAVSFILQENYLSALKLLDSIEQEKMSPQEKEEIKFWHQVAELGLRVGGEHLSYLNTREGVLASYPKEIGQKIGLMEAASRIERKGFTVAEGILEAIQSEADDPGILREVTFLQGELAAQKNEVPKAISYWERLTQDVTDRKYRAKAGFATIKLLLAQKQLTPMQAIEKINAMRMVWRGDEIEAGMLKKLGELYAQEKHYPDALRTWRQIITYFPNTGDALFIAANMSKLFIYLFGEDGLKEASDFEAVALYYEFKELTPIGKSGDLVIQSLVERLIRLDLLDRAVALLTHQVKYRTKEKERSRLGTLLALVHLLNRQPAQAIEALHLSDYEDITEELSLERLHLKAKALIDMDKGAEAIELLSEDDTLMADKLRLDMYWNKRDWIQVKALLALQMDTHRNNKKPLTPEEYDQLLRLVTANIMLRDISHLKTLNQKYSALAPKGSHLAALLSMGAKDPSQINIHELENSVQIEKMEEFLDSYRHAAKRSQLMEVLKKEAAK